MWQLLIPAVTTVLDKILPDPAQAAEAKIKVLELAQRGELAALDADMRLAMGQLEVNKVEAESNDKVKSYWRPATGWVCVFGLAYQFLLQPLLPWVVTVFGVAVPPLPPIDGETLTGLLFALLGIGGFRSLEKVKGKA